VITVFGCGGEADRAKRPIMGRISGYLSDYTIITSDNPKGEDPEMIIKEIETGISTITKAYETIVDRGEAIKRALEIAKRGDVVLIAGKGHERTQVFKGKEIKFSDRLFLQEMGMINL
jgi:UDP-N-acetylmuramoyl-L-alanyl-D-glutamate--2,6-diaminopimelate ligase